MKVTKKVSKKIFCGKPVYAIIYSRTSTRRGSEQKMRQQEQQCLKFAQAEGYIVKEDAIFREIVSGKEQYRKRPVLVEILDYIERLPKKQYILIVTSMQRISRNKRNLSYYSKFLYTRGVLIDSLNCLSEQSFEDRMSKLLDSIFKWSERNVVVRLVKPKRDRSGVDHK